MLHFLRNIRKKLLYEGKTTRYLTYALGEIILVVIGILIALQINNWNDNQKEKRHTLELLDNLSQELKQDSTYLKNVYQVEKELVLPSAETLFRAHANRSLTARQDSLIGPAFRFCSFTPTIKYSNNVFNELMAANLLKGKHYESMKSKLFEYYAQLDFLRSYSEKNIYFETNIMDELSPYYTVMLPEGEEYRETSKFSGAAESTFLVEYDLEAFRSNKRLNAQLYDMVDIHKDRLGGIEIILQLSVEIQSDIQSILNADAP